MNILQPIAIIVGVVSGVSGLVLGILNYWHRRVSTRPCLVVRPLVSAVWRADNTVEKAVGLLEICNVGQVPVVGEAAALIYDGKRKGIILGDKPVIGVSWPTEIKPQQSVTLHFDLYRLPEATKLDHAIVRSAVGDVFKPSRRDMRWFRKDLAELQCKPTPPHPATP